MHDWVLKIDGDLKKLKYMYIFSIPWNGKCKYVLKNFTDRRSTKGVEEFTIFKLVSIILQLPLKHDDDLPIFIPHWLLHYESILTFWGRIAHCFILSFEWNRY